MDFLEYSDISADVKGTQTKGRLKMTDQSIVFKNNKTGKVEQINAAEMEFVNFQRMLDTYGIRIFMKNGTLHRFSGFKDNEQEKIASFFKNNYKQEMLEKELSFRGWNWGTAQFSGSLLSFNVENKTSFEIPLDVVSQCTPGKNEVTLEFHQNDEGPVSLMEMRFHIPTTETSDTDPVDAFYQNVMNKASVISVSGDAIAIFREIHCLTPRGRYDIKMFQTFFQLHGKTFDYKIPMSTVLRLFLLPHKDNRQMFFVLSLDPPIKQGQTRYHYLVILFNMEDETSIELPFSEDDLKNKYENKLTKELSGPVYEVLGKIMKVLINRKLTGPGSFIGHSGTPAISCSFKAAAGYLYPLERGFIYVHKPPLHIRFEEISAVNFARSGGSTRSFDFEIELRQGTVHTFSSIEKEEYNKLFDFITSKKLHVKNTGKGDKTGYSMDDFGNSDNENEPDAYLARVKAEAKERDDDDDDDQNSDESTDEDFKPNEQESDVAEEFDSNASSSDSSDNSDASGGGGGEKKKEKKSSSESKEKEKKKKKEKSSSKKEKSSSKSSKSSKSKKDDGKPKRPSTAFMIFMAENREKIKTDNPGISFTDIARKAGEIWKEMSDKSVYEEKAAKEKEKYTEAMKNYKPSKDDSDEEDGGAKGKKRKKESSSSAAAAANSPKKATSMAGTGFKSKEYISDEDSSSNGDGDSSGSEKKSKSKKSKKSSPKKAKSPPKKKPEPRKKRSKSDDDNDDEDVDELPDDEEEMTTTEESGSGSDSD